MILNIPKDLLDYLDIVKCRLSRPVYILKCLRYIKIKGITLNEIENTISTNYESALKYDRINKPKLEGES